MLGANPTLEPMREAWPDDPTIWFGGEFEPLVTLHLPREPVSQGADARKRRGIRSTYDPSILKLRLHRG